MTEVPFRFGLERVRELRAHDEDKAREQFAASLGRRARGAAMLQAAHDLIAEAQDGRRAGATSEAPVSGTDLLGQQLWLERLQRHRDTAERDLQHVDSQLAVHREELNEARQKREVLEKLKDRRRDEHTREGARREGIALDEMALSNHVRRAAAR